MFRTQYSKDRNKKHYVVKCGQDKVVQHLDEFCSISKIYEKYSAGEKIHTVPVTYGDLPQLGDFRAAKDLMDNVNNFFNSLPADVRSNFNGKCEEFIKAVGSCGNDSSKIAALLDKGVKLNVPTPSSVDASSLSSPQFDEVTQKTSSDVSKVAE